MGAISFSLCSHQQAIVSLALSPTFIGTQFAVEAEDGQHHHGTVHIGRVFAVRRGPAVPAGSASRR